MGVRQALLRKTGEHSYERISNYVKCRDFLVDSYTYAKAEKDFSIYGYQFSGSKLQPDWTGTYLSLKFHSATERLDFLKNVGYIHAIEHANGWPQTVLKDVEKSLEMIVEGDIKWIKNCLTFSLYSFLLRVACYKDFSKTGEPTVGEWLIQFGKEKFSDSKYVASVDWKTWDRVLGDLDILSTPTWCGFDPRNSPTSTIHHNSGFISVFGSHSEISYACVRRNTHWQLMRERGLEMHPEALKAA